MIYKYSISITYYNRDQNKLLAYTIYKRDTFKLFQLQFESAFVCITTFFYGQFLFELELIFFLFFFCHYAYKKVTICQILRNVDSKQFRASWAFTTHHKGNHYSWNDVCWQRKRRRFLGEY